MVNAMLHSVVMRQRKRKRALEREPPAWDASAFIQCQIEQRLRHVLGRKRELTSAGTDNRLGIPVALGIVRDSVILRSSTIEVAAAGAPVGELLSNGAT